MSYHIKYCPEIVDEVDVVRLDIPPEGCVWPCAGSKEFSIWMKLDAWLIYVWSHGAHLSLPTFRVEEVSKCFQDPETWFRITVNVNTPSIICLTRTPSDIWIPLLNLLHHWKPYQYGGGCYTLYLFHTPQQLSKLQWFCLIHFIKRCPVEWVQEELHPFVDVVN